MKPPAAVVRGLLAGLIFLQPDSSPRVQRQEALALEEIKMWQILLLKFRSFLRYRGKSVPRVPAWVMKYSVSKFLALA